MGGKTKADRAEQDLILECAYREGYSIKRAAEMAQCAETTGWRKFMRFRDLKVPRGKVKRAPKRSAPKYTGPDWIGSAA